MFFSKVVRSNSNNIVLGLIAVFFFLFSASILDYFDFIKTGLIKQIILILLAVIFCWLIARYMITEYTYSAISGEFIIKKKLGRKTETVLNIDMKSITLITDIKNKEILKPYKGADVINATLSPFGLGSVVMVYKENKKYKKICLKKSKDLMTFFKSRIK